MDNAARCVEFNHVAIQSLRARESDHRAEFRGTTRGQIAGEPEGIGVASKYFDSPQRRLQSILSGATSAGNNAAQRFGHDKRANRARFRTRTGIRSFAACCGTHLFLEDSKESDNIDFTIASLDDRSSFAPRKVIWLEDKLPWGCDRRVDSVIPENAEEQLNRGSSPASGYNGKTCSP